MDETTVSDKAVVARYVIAQKRYQSLVSLLNNYSLPLELHDEIAFLGQALGFDRDR